MCARSVSVSWPVNLRIASRHKSGSFQAICPCHEDRVASVTITVKPDRVLVYDHAGCSTEQILAAWGVTYGELGELMSGVVPVTGNQAKLTQPDNGSPKKRRAEIIETYDYQDEDGKLLFQVCRTEPKGFLQRVACDDGSWSWSTEGCRKVLYRLPRLVRLLAGSPVVVCEGERCVHALEGLGFIATTSPGGASSWREDLSVPLRIAKVTVLHDQDEPGLKYANAVVSSLRRHTQVAIVTIPGLPNKGDVCDFVKAGGTAKDLLKIIKNQTEE